MEDFECKHEEEIFFCEHSSFAHYVCGECDDDVFLPHVSRSAMRSVRKMERIDDA